LQHIPAESRHIADCVGKSARPAGRKVVVLHGPLLKILVDDLGEANSRVQQLPPVLLGLARWTGRPGVASKTGEISGPA